MSERIIPTTPGDIAVYYHVTPGQRGTPEQPEFKPSVEISGVHFIDKLGHEHSLEEKTETALREAFQHLWEEEILNG